MDISKLHDKSHLFSLDIVNPETDEPVGISMKIRSVSSDDVSAVIRRHTNENVELRQKGKTLSAKKLEEQEAEKTAACIASWDWGENTYGNLGVPADTWENKVKVLIEQGWIYQQVAEAANTFGNFTTQSGKAASKPSK
ncbi:hypothetical protein [Martelella limonii]|uniref:hypothetical protein n=1 Tax=Martelella limonii TaxID=1647649 RepID=UPI001580D429|nr:hypothetical protein [Martelella limonii]